MKLKLDENLDVRLVAILRQAGHEVATVRDQGLAGVDGQALFTRCSSEARLLVTLDLDFPAFFGTLPRPAGASLCSAGLMTLSLPCAS
jgi:predicted nuclease of predicted toxin-antitoxin system